MSRKIILLIIWIGLLASVPLLRSCRFEQDPVFAPLTIEDLKHHNPVLPPGASWGENDGKSFLRVVKLEGKKYQSFPLKISDVGAVHACHMVVSAHAEHLTVGQNPWDTGRVMIFWKDLSDQRFREFDMAAGVVKNETIRNLSQVMRPASGLAEPHLRIEHLGSSGALTITRLDLMPVIDRDSWEYFRWLVVAFWVGGNSLHLRWVWGGRTWRHLLASVVWIFCASLVSFPGPWKNVRPCFIPFQICNVEFPAKTSSPQAGITTASTPVEQTNIHPSAQQPDHAIASPEIKHIRKISPQDAWMVAAKAALAKFRWVIHAMMLIFPCLLWGILVGRRATIALGMSFAVSMELAQVSFGFGFDAKDVVDLLSNSLGIAIAILVIAWLSRTKWFGPLCRRLMPTSES